VSHPRAADVNDPMSDNETPPPGWRINNPDWPSGDGPHLVRCDDEDDPDNDSRPLGALYEVDPARWSKIPAGVDIVVWQRPSVTVSHRTITSGKVVQMTDHTSTNVPAIRLRTIGDTEVLLPRDTVVIVQRRRPR
jgi:hypothetical protein